MVEVDLVGHAIVVQVGQIGKGLGKRLGSAGQVFVERARFERELLLEQGGEHDGGRARVFHAAHVLDRL